jgi:Fe-S cluster biogenesis protein NfuA
LPQSIEHLVKTIEELPDPAARASAIALMQALMDFHGEALDRLMEIVATKGPIGYEIFDEFSQDEKVSSLLLLYGLHPEPIETRVARALEKVRPYLDLHGGNVELVGINEGVVRLRLMGSCKGCPSSSMTLKLAIEEAIFSLAPDVVSIEAESEEVSDQEFVQIRKAAAVEAPRFTDCNFTMTS